MEKGEGEGEGGRGREREGGKETYICRRDDTSVQHTFLVSTPYSKDMGC